MNFFLTETKPQPKLCVLTGQFACLHTVKLQSSTHNQKTWCYCRNGANYNLQKLQITKLHSKTKK